MPRFVRRRSTPDQPPPGGGSGAGGAGDDDLYEALYRQEVDRIYRICYARLGNRQEAEDAAADVFVKLLKELGRKKIANPGGWLTTAATTTAIDHLRKLRPVAPLDDEPMIEDPTPTPEEQALSREQLRELRDVLQLLPPLQRQVVAYWLEDLTPVEIARLLSRDRNRVDVALSRAKKRLRQLLTERAPKGGDDHGH